uniref:RING-type E3 ubiquitin transferase n=1 Tax=Timema douglasi TaxID=61478 RepID=A0A7R8VMW1_TIMDO|nr:unnamed protein product [Timema douglasi]
MDGQNVNSKFITLLQEHIKSVTDSEESRRLVIMSQLKEMDELLRCSVCTERYNIDTRKPKILMCHHTFCLKCLKGWASKQANSKNGINISCPSCRKVTSVGKKGVSSLQDNFYLEHVQSAVNAMDGIFVSDEEEIHDKKSAQDNIRYKIWCQTCKKTASSSCSTDSDHNICNFVQGAVEHLQNLRQGVTEKLLTEINCWETVVAFFESSMSVLKSVDASGQIQEDLNSYRLALTVARSELDAMLELNTISNKDPPSLLVVIKLRHDIAPKMCANFVALCTGELGFGYKGTIIFNAHPNEHVIGGDIENNDGTGGYSIYNNKGLFIADECSLRDEMGAIRMRGMGTDIKTGNGLVGSQFHIWLGRRDFRVYRRTLVIGQVVQGLNILQDISMFKAIRKSDGNFVLTTKAIIKNCGTY